MPQPITPDVLVAYRQCPRKAFLLLCTDEEGSPHDYASMLARQQAENRASFIGHLKQQHPEARPYAGKLPGAEREILTGVTLRVQDLEASCDVLMPVTRAASVRAHRYEPTIVVGTRTISQEQQLELLFVSYVLGRLQRALLPMGTIVGLGEQVHRVPLAKQYAQIDPIVEVLRAWRRAPSADPPPVILNQHCPECQFRVGCLAQAERDDDLSLLDRMTPKARLRYHNRGIFTTLGKALGGASGGFIAARSPIVELLQQRCRPYLFSNALAPSVVAGSRAALALVNESTALRDRLAANTRRFRTAIAAAGLEIRPGDHPIVPIMLGDARRASEMAARLLADGIYVVGFSYPVVPRGQARIRVQLSAGHTDAHIDFAAEAFGRIRQDLTAVASVS